jgi:hypothetical protein
VSGGPPAVSAPSSPARGPLGRALDRLYDGSAALAAVAMVLLLVMVMLSIISRQVGFNVPGVDAYAGYMMAAAGFLAMAHTLKKGEHIRVTLLISALRGSAHRALEIWALFAAALLAALLAVVRLPRRLDQQRRDAALAARAVDGGRRGGPGACLRRRAGARDSRPARRSGQRRGDAQ